MDLLLRGKLEIGPPTHKRNLMRLEFTRETLNRWPVFVISLADHAHRRQPLMDQLAQYGIDHQLFTAVDARKEVPNKYRHLISEELTLYHFGRPMSSGEYGCALSHQLVYQEVCDQGLAGAVVFEDDARLLPGAAEILKLRFYESFDFIQFNYGFARVPRLGIGRKRIAPGYATERALANSGLASAYALSRKACEYMIRESIPISKPADWPCDLRPLKPRLTVPKLASAPEEDPSQSSLMIDRRQLRTSDTSISTCQKIRSEGRSPKNPQSWLLRRFGWCYAKTLSGRPARGLRGLVKRLGLSI